MADPQYLLEVKNLRQHFTSGWGRNKLTVKAVEDVSFGVRPAETFGLVGESGCGKTTTGRTIIRLYTPTSGEMYFDGRDIAGPMTNELRKYLTDNIAMIFQDPMTALNPVYTIGYQISENLLEHNKGMKKSEALDKSVQLLKAMGIPMPEQRVNEYPHQFSGGMRQRAMIAMAMACNPQLLLADEPTTALDVTVQAQIFELMADLKTNYNAAVILITHDMGVVTELADNVSVMYMGYVVEEGSVDEVLRTPAHPYTKALLSAIPVADITKTKTRIPLQGDVPSPANPPSGCTFHPRCPECSERCKVETPVLEQYEINGVNHSVACFKVKEALAHKEA